MAAILSLAALRIATLRDPQHHAGALFGAYVVLAVAGAAGAASLWNSNNRRLLGVALAGAIVARAVLLPGEPLLSHDAYRYLWDGQLVLQGFNPLAIAPESSALSHLHRGWLYALIDYRHVPSLYPPIAYALFICGALISSASVIGEKLVMSAGDLIAGATIVAVLHRRKLPLGRAALYAWNPVVLLEFSQSGHLEAWSIAAIVTSVLFLDSKRPVAAGAAMALAVLTKLYPIVLAPVAFARDRTALMTTGGIVASVYAVSLAFNRDTFGSLASYVDGQHFNATFFALLGSKGAAAALLAGTTYAVVLRRRGASLVAALLWVEIVYLLVIPNVLPWYVAVIAAIVPLMDDPFGPARRPLTLGALGWTVTAPLAYAAPLVVAGGSAGDLAMRAVEYAPLAAGVAIVAQRAARGRLHALRISGARA